MENYNQIMENKMMSILNSMNENIQTLTDVLEAKGELEKKYGVKSETARLEEDEAKVIRTKQGEEKTQEQLAEENQEAREVAQTMKELEKEIEG